MSSDVTDVVGDWAEVLKKPQFAKERHEFAALYPHKRSFEIDCRILQACGTKGLLLADEIIARPTKSCGDVLDALCGRLDLVPEKERKTVRVRVIGLPKHTSIEDVGQRQTGRLISIEGIVRKAADPVRRCTSAAFRCLACGQPFPPLPQKYGKFQEPFTLCSVCQKKTPIEFVPEKSEFVDSQKIRIQESPEGLSGGEKARTIDAVLEDDLVNRVSAGARVVVTGIARLLQRQYAGSKSPLFDTYIEAVGLEVLDQGYAEIQITEDDETQIQALAACPDCIEQIAQSIAPSIYGNEGVKTAIALQLFGGTPKLLPDGARLRGDIHIFLVGDPGIAKSQILRFVAGVSPHGVFASGKGASAAGLTASAVKDDFGDGGWTLEAGALVLADLGTACIDEMDKVGEEDRKALHEAMEQQSVPINKAGLNVTLNTRCAILGAANPKMGRFDPLAPLGDQIAMPPTLLSRFDLIYILRDVPEKERDHAIADHIARTHLAGELLDRQRKGADVDEAALAEALAPIEAPLPPDQLRKYVAYARRRPSPALSPDARDALTRYFEQIRSLADNNKPVPVTARQLEALIRLAEAAARMRLADEVTAEDAALVIKIVDTCLRQVAYDPKTGLFDIDLWMSGIGERGRTLRRRIVEAIEASAAPGGTVERDNVVRLAASADADRGTVDGMIGRLIEEGVIRERDGLLRLVRSPA